MNFLFAKPYIAYPQTRGILHWAGVSLHQAMRERMARPRPLFRLRQCMGMLADDEQRRPGSGKLTCMMRGEWARVERRR